VAWQPFVAALFAPAAVWVLWRLQILSVEMLRGRLLRLATVRDQRWLYAIVSWFGVFLHEVSHASVLLLSGHGIREFRAGMEQGHVLPARMRRGPLGFLFFLVAALAPLFIPPLLFLAALLWLTGSHGFVFSIPAPGLEGALDGLQHSLVEVPLRIATALASLDLRTWQGGLLLVLALLAMPSGRPSHVKASRFHGKDEGDVAVLRQQIRRNPWYFLLFLGLLYGAYFLHEFYPPAYWYPFQALWAVALTGVALAILGTLWWGLIGLGARTKALVWWLGPASFAVVQVLAPMEPLQRNGVALLVWAVTAVALRLALPRGGRIP
jgi:hypothetical protein